MEKLRKSTKGAVDMASWQLEKAKFKLMRTSETEAEIDEDQSQVSETSGSSRMDQFTDTFCPKLTFQQVCDYNIIMVVFLISMDWWTNDSGPSCADPHVPKLVIVDRD